ncbi:hypothetical protein [Nostoc sp. DedQUE03]|uniref:hypothetical protein n=1 Tax=Nostoc sp. DedQUE03 TaxID=3075389 RepID=UPI002AD349F6|nr:hypothetical protein [Nostoc sp. DedQUE03]MDZ7971543.1 hypothetical protein [Nostoc sp. DedQUE03]
MKTEVAATIAEVVTRYVKHGNVKTEVAATIAEVATENINSDRPRSFPKVRSPFCHRASSKPVRLSQ